MKMMEKCASIICLFSLLTTTELSAQKLKEVKYYEGNQELRGLVTQNSTIPGPAVLILPAWKGIDNEAKASAIALKNEGYTAFIADIYGVGNVPTDNESAGTLSSKYKSDYRLYQNRISAAIVELKKLGATKIAIIGYCFGGTGALEAARGNLPVEGAVCIHGGLAKSADRTNGEIIPKVLVQHPADDVHVKKVDYDGLVKELNEGRADWQIQTYANSKHTFTDPESEDYNKVMADRAWNHTLIFLKEVLK